MNETNSRLRFSYSNSEMRLQNDFTISQPNYFQQLLNRNALGLEGSSNFGVPGPQLLNGTATESEDVGKKDDEMGIKVNQMQLNNTEFTRAQLKVFGVEESPPCRVVYLTCEAAGVPYATDKVDPMAGDNMRPEFLKAG